jgi:WhiB family redox-sensing transcriptional regulator
MRENENDGSPACATANPELWFAERPADLMRAKTICVTCPLRTACLAGALERHEPWGVWGGEIVEYGVVLAYKRGRGRPSNADRRLGLATVTADGRARRPGRPGTRSLGEARPTGFTTPGTEGTCRSASA